MNERLFSAPFSEVVRGDLLILNEGALVVVDNYPGRKHALLKDPYSGEHYKCEYTDNEFAVVEEMPVAFG